MHFLNHTINIDYEGNINVTVELHIEIPVNIADEEGHMLTFFKVAKVPLLIQIPKSQ